MAEPSTSVALFVLKPVARQLVARLAERLGGADRRLMAAREDLALQWGAELRAVLPLVIEQLNARVDELEQKIAAELEDRQLVGVFSNFEFEAAREAIEERRRMLAHAAVGLLDPDLPIERKARVERTLRNLDPEDVLTLFGLALVPGGQTWTQRHDLLFSVPSGDVLTSCGCVRVEAVTGFGGGRPDIQLTQLATDVLRVVRTYTITRLPTFDVPGREVNSGDLTEEAARKRLGSVPLFGGFLQAIVRRSAHVQRTYTRPKDSAAQLEAVVVNWEWLLPQAEALVDPCATIGLDVKVHQQPYQPSEGHQATILRVAISGPHDVLRYAADDCEAIWM